MKRYFINVIASQDLVVISDYFYLRKIEAGERFFQVLIAGVNSWLLFLVWVEAMLTFSQIHVESLCRTTSSFTE